MTCTSSYGFSTYCHLPTGHPGDHTNGRRTWTDTDAETTGKQSSKKWKGEQTNGIRPE